MTCRDFAWPQGKRAAVSVTFDDARLTQPDAGFAILDASGVRATFYVTPEQVATRLPAWKAAVARGHEIGNHTLLHPCTGNYPWSRARALEDYTLDRIIRDIDDADGRIREMLAVTPRTFAYPCGQSYVGRGRERRSYVPIVADRFLAARGATGEIDNDPSFSDLADLSGISIDGRTWEGTRRLLETAVERGRWIVFYGHEIADDRPQAVRPAVLEALCRRCADGAGGIWIDTVAAIAEYVHGFRSS